MVQNLSVSKLIAVTLNLSPIPAQFLNFDTVLLLGDSDVINTGERTRSYTDLDSVAADFGTTAPEYLAAELYFSQTPPPNQPLYIGRWAQSATAGVLVGGPLSAANKVMTVWTAVAAGSLHIGFDGQPAIDVTGINLAAQTTLNGVATAIQTALRAKSGTNPEFGNVVVTYNASTSQFTIKSGTTGASSSVTALSAAGSGTDISALLNGTAATLSQLVNGIAAETALQAVTILDNLNSPQWYGLTIASTHIADADYLAIAGFIEGSDITNPHIFGITTADATAVVSGDTTSIGAQLNALGYRRTFVQYSVNNPYAAMSILARGSVVNFNESLSVITFMWKTEPGVVAENLSASQAAALDANHYNYFATYNNGIAIVTNGMVANGDFIDNTWDLDWELNQIQTDVFNLMYTAGTKVPQTDSGNHMIKTVIEKALGQGVVNGTFAPGVWNKPGFGNLSYGDFLSKGYYVYQPPIATQADADRAARKSVPFQAAAILAGAVHTVSITVNVNR